MVVTARRENPVQSPVRKLENYVQKIRNYGSYALVKRGTRHKLYNNNIATII